MRNQVSLSRIPYKASLAAMGILATGAGLVRAFQEPPGVSSQPINVNDIMPPPAELNTAAVPVRLATERPDDVSAIQRLTAFFVKAFNAGDAAALALTFTENARVIDENNQLSEGRAAIAARFARSFSAHKGESIAVAPETIRFLGPDTAIEEGTATIKMPTAGATAPEVEASRYTVVYVKRDNAWLHASIRDHLAGAVGGATDSVAASDSNYDRLRMLEWLIGDWVEEGPDVVMSSSFAWSDNRNFLIRTFRLKVPGRPVLTGTQRIGWDPSTKQIRSWEFDSDGSFGEGTWSRRGDDEWIAKMSGVRHDGRIASDTRVIVRTGADQLTWKAFDRTLGGEVQEDTPEFPMVRSAPRPGAAKIKRVTE